MGVGEIHEGYPLPGAASTEEELGMIAMAARLTAKTPPAVGAGLVIAATVGLMVLLGAAPADAVAAPVGGAPVSTGAPTPW
ncbi:hypothetical protein LCL87_01765 [Rhodococcus hoagii]|nr:hypothetical protein [Prescottella equi]